MVPNCLLAAYVGQSGLLSGYPLTIRSVVPNCLLAAYVGQSGLLSGYPLTIRSVVPNCVLAAYVGQSGLLSGWGQRTACEAVPTNRLQIITDVQILSNCLIIEK